MTVSAGVDQRPVQRGALAGVHCEPEAAHGMTVDRVLQVGVEGLLRPEAKDHAVARQRKRPLLEELPARDTQYDQAAWSDRVEFVAQHDLSISALRHRIQEAARNARRILRKQAISEQLFVGAKERLAHKADTSTARRRGRRGLL